MKIFFYFGLVFDEVFKVKVIFCLFGEYAPSCFAYTVNADSSIERLQQRHRILFSIFDDYAVSKSVKIFTSFRAFSNASKFHSANSAKVHKFNPYLQRRRTVSLRIFSKGTQMKPVKSLLQELPVPFKGALLQ